MRFYENMEEIMKNKENLLEIEGLSKNFQMHLNKKEIQACQNISLNLKKENLSVLRDEAAVENLRS